MTNMVVIPEQSTQVAQHDPNAVVALEKLILKGDLSSLTPVEKVMHYKNVCESAGLNPLTAPLSFIRFPNGKELLYAGKNCTEQLRSLHGVSLTIRDKQRIDDLYIVSVAAQDRTGRIDESTAAVSIKGLHGDNLANALMKCETKAKRRVTLSITGLGFLDETEVDTINGASKMNVNLETGEILKIEPIPPKETFILEGKVLDDYANLSAFKAADDKENAWKLIKTLSDDEKRKIAKHCFPELLEWIKATSAIGKAIEEEQAKQMPDLAGAEYGRV